MYKQYIPAQRIRVCFHVFRYIYRIFFLFVVVFLPWILIILKEFGNSLRTQLFTLPAFVDLIPSKKQTLKQIRH